MQKDYRCLFLSCSGEDVAVVNLALWGIPKSSLNYSSHNVLDEVLDELSKSVDLTLIFTNRGM
jgi:hypothetical protein